MSRSRLEYRQQIITGKAIDWAQRQDVYCRLLELPLGTSEERSALAQRGIQFQSLLNQAEGDIDEPTKRALWLQSTLAQLCPVLQAVEYLGLAKKLVRLSTSNMFVLQTAVQILGSFMKDAFVNYPAPPRAMLGKAVGLLQKVNPSLARHGKAKKFDWILFLWAFIQNLYSTQLGLCDWAYLLDYLACFTNNPVYLLTFSVAFICKIQSQIKSCKDQQQFMALTKRQFAPDMCRVFAKAVVFVNYMQHQIQIGGLNKKLALQLEFPESAIPFIRKKRKQIEAKLVEERFVRHSNILQADGRPKSGGLKVLQQLLNKNNSLLSNYSDYSLFNTRPPQSQEQEVSLKLEKVQFKLLQTLVKLECLGEREKKSGILKGQSQVLLLSDGKAGLQQWRVKLLQGRRDWRRSSQRKLLLDLNV